MTTIASNFNVLYSIIDGYYKSGILKLTISEASEHHNLLTNRIPDLLTKKPRKIDIELSKKRVDQYTLLDIYTLWKNIIVSTQAKYGGLSMKDSYVLRNTLLYLEKSLNEKEKIIEIPTADE